MRVMARAVWSRSSVEVSGYATSSMSLTRIRAISERRSLMSAASRRACCSSGVRAVE